MLEKDLGHIIAEQLKNAGINAAWIKREYHIHVGAKFFAVDLAIVDDDDTLYGAFEFKSVLNENGGIKNLAKDRVNFLIENGVYCYLVIRDKGGVKIIERSHKGKWRSFRCRNCKIPKRIIASINPERKVCARTVAEYLEKVVWAKFVLSHRISCKEKVPETNETPWKFLFRGQSDKAWRLVPSLFRKIDEHATPLAQSLYAEEMNIFYEAQRIAPDAFECCKSDIDKLAVMQHHEIPTRLLDVTGNALVALYFAVQRGTADGSKDTDGSVYVFGASQNDFTKALEYAQINEKNWLCRYHSGDMCGKRVMKPILVIPSFLTARQRAQDGSFYLFLNTSDGKNLEFRMQDYVCIIISHDCKRDVLEELEKSLNIHKGSLFPETLADSRDRIIGEAKDRIRNKNRIALLG